MMMSGRLTALKKGIMKVGLYTISSSFISPKSILIKTKGFDEILTSSIDYNFWMTLSEDGLNAIAVDEPLVITHQEKQKKSMITARPRIKGIEQFLFKWETTLLAWYRKREGKRYIMHHLARILGQIAGKKLIGNAIGEAWNFIQHILKQSTTSIGLYIYLTFQVLHSSIKFFILKKFMKQLRSYGK
jgi:hypothetical protein